MNPGSPVVDNGTLPDWFRQVVEDFRQAGGYSPKSCRCYSCVREEERRTRFETKKQKISEGNSGGNRGTGQHVPLQGL